MVTIWVFALPGWLLSKTLWTADAQTPLPPALLCLCGPDSAALTLRRGLGEKPFDDALCHLGAASGFGQVKR